MDGPTKPGSASPLASSLVAPAALVVLALTAIVAFAAHAPWLVPIGVVVYALIVSVCRRQQGDRGTVRRSVAPLAPQYRVWDEHAEAVCASILQIVQSCAPDTRPLVEPIHAKAVAMATKLGDLAVQADRLYQYLLSHDPREIVSHGDLQDISQAQRQPDSRRQIAALHESIVTTARDVLDAMDAVQTQSLRLATGDISRSDSAVGEALQKLDDMRATADALEEVVARTQVGFASG